MTKETYEKMTQPFRDNPKLAKSLHIANKILETIVFLSYLLLLAGLFWKKDENLLRAVLVPLDGVIIVSVIRYMINRPRPYEKFETEPVIKKDTKGKSFPSRHIFSSAVIALTFFAIPGYLWIGAALLFCAVLLAVIRVVSGVHFISDVIAGFAFAVICAVIGMLFF
jgi:membrane-associated phospholipid phosphatase